MKLKAFKVYIKDEEHCAKVQKALFSVGYRWEFGPNKVQLLHARVLYCSSAGNITFAVDENFRNVPDYPVLEL